MKGIILAGGSGSRLHPLTKVISKQLQPIYDKPMIYYPLSLLMLGGIREILLITTEVDSPRFQNLLGDGRHLGLSIEYKIQNEPRGIPEAFILGENFIQKDNVCLILGDNLFHGDITFFRDAIKAQKAGTDGKKGRIFGHLVADPERYGIVEFNPTNLNILSIEEKPAVPKSHYAIPGLYLFDCKAVEKSFALKPSARGELEITDLIKDYFKAGTLDLTPVNRGVAWLDMGTPKSLLEASSYIMAIEERQGLKVGCLEEVAWRMEYLNLSQFSEVIRQLPSSPYRKYLEGLLLQHHQETRVSP